MQDSNNLSEQLNEMSVSKDNSYVREFERNPTVFASAWETALGPTISNTPIKLEVKLPQVDFGTFTPLLGTKFFCFNPSSLGSVTSEIQTYLNCPHSTANYDFDEANHVWMCNETSGYDTVQFNISLYECSTKNKIFVKFHRFGGSPSVFMSSVTRFCEQAYVTHELRSVNPSDLSESAIDSASMTKKRKGSFKCLPLPLSIRQRTVSSSEFISYCEIFNIWAKSDVPECLSSILTSMPKMWKDLSLFYKGIEELPVGDKSASTAELLLMFASINKIYKNLSAITVQAHYALHSGSNQHHVHNVIAQPVAVITPEYVTPQATAATTSPAVPEQPDYVGNYNHNYDFLDDDYEVRNYDGTQTAGDDFHYGANAAQNNQGYRHTVTMDITKSAYRSMAVFDGTADSGVGHFEAYDSASEVMNSVDPKKAHLVEVNVMSKQQSSDSNKTQSELFRKLLNAIATASQVLETQSTAASCDNLPFKDMFTQRSKEELSKILSLSLACISSQLSYAQDMLGLSSPRVVSTLDVPLYITKLLKSSSEFVHVLDDIALSPEVTPVLNHTYDLHNEKQIVCLAKLIKSEL